MRWLEGSGLHITARGWPPGPWTCGLIHQPGRFDSDNGLISSDRRGGRRFMAPLPSGPESELSGSIGDLIQPEGGLYLAQEAAVLEAHV